MINPHTATAVTQVIFYVPVLPAAFFVLIRNWNNRPRLAWYPLIPFSLFRLVGGTLIIILESDQHNIGLIIAATVMLNVGLIPLIVSTVGIIRIILNSSNDKNQRAHFFLKLIRIAFVAAIVLLVVSGSLGSSGRDTATARYLAQAAYIVFAIVLVLLTVELLHLYTQRHRLATESFTYVRLTLVGIPMLTMRAVYGLLHEFTSEDIYAVWDPLYGSTVAYVLMCLLSEYIPVLIYIYLGIYRIRNPTSVETE